MRKEDAKRKRGGVRKNATNAEKSNRDMKTVEDVKQKTKGLEPSTKRAGPKRKPKRTEIKQQGCEVKRTEC